MPYKALALYPMPDDPQDFRAHYENIHLPLVAKLPGLRSLRYSIDLIAPQGDAPYFAVFEVEWDDAEAMATSLNSPEGQAVAADMAPYVTEGTVLLNYTPRTSFLASVSCAPVRVRAAGKLCDGSLDISNPSQSGHIDLDVCPILEKSLEFNDMLAR
jgi:uncharacterized protein (TIGR02118 family)